MSCLRCETCDFDNDSFISCPMASGAVGKTAFLEKDATWEQVKQKGRMIFERGGVELESQEASGRGTWFAKVDSNVVKGDSECPLPTIGDVYDVIVAAGGYEGTSSTPKNTGGWIRYCACSCLWGRYRMDGNGIWRDRLCSHVYATILAINKENRLPNRFKGDRSASVSIPITIDSVVEIDDIEIGAHGFVQPSDGFFDPASGWGEPPERGGYEDLDATGTLTVNGAPVAELSVDISAADWFGYGDYPAMEAAARNLMENIVDDALSVMGEDTLDALLSLIGADADTNYVRKIAGKKEKKVMAHRKSKPSKTARIGHPLDIDDQFVDDFGRWRVVMTQTLSTGEKGYLVENMEDGHDEWVTMDDINDAHAEEIEGARYWTTYTLPMFSDGNVWSSKNSRRKQAVKWQDATVRDPYYSDWGQEQGWSIHMVRARISGYTITVKNSDNGGIFVTAREPRSSLMHDYSMHNDNIECPSDWDQNAPQNAIVEDAVRRWIANGFDVTPLESEGWYSWRNASKTATSPKGDPMYKNADIFEFDMLVDNDKTASWPPFNSPIADEMNDLYLPSYGDGDNMATQAVTAANKLIYKWFNDGDVYDNTYGMEGWCNDISGSANWLYNHIPSLQSTLLSIKDCRNDAQYEEILFDVFTTILEDPEYLENLSRLPKIGDAYNEDGPFEFVEHEEEWDDDDDWW